MSLGIVVLTDEGVVMAAESLGTLLVQTHAEIQSPCKKCKEQVKPNMICPKCSENLGPFPKLSQQLPATHTYYCQKLFKLNEHAGLIIVGSPLLGAMKAQHRVFCFINWLKEKTLYTDYAEQMVAHWQTFCNEGNILQAHGAMTEIAFAGIKTNGSLLPFAQTMKMTKGKIEIGGSLTAGIVAIGVHEILDKMFLGGGIREYPVKEFPLQDAVEFSEFLMQTQIGVDKYTARIPRVGGDIDVAVIHPNHGFAWVRQKSLIKTIEQQANQGVQTTQ